MATSSLWQRFQQYYLHYDDIGFSLDISRMRFPDRFLEEIEPKVEKAFAAMRDLEAGGIANPDEKRMVGHYWLRNPQLAPNDELRADIEQTNARIQKFASDVHVGRIAAGKKAATQILQLQPRVLAQLSASGTTAEAIAQAIDADPEEVYHVLRHLAANDASIKTKGNEPGTEEFSRIK